MSEPSEIRSLYLVRHALAEERGDAWPDDDLRPLSAKGVHRFRRVASALAALDVRVDRVLSSPLVRARQTAEILAEHLAGPPEIVELPALRPDSEFEDVRPGLEQFSADQCLIIVGHEPCIGQMAARLLGLRHPLEFRTGAVCRIDVDTIPPAAPGDLRWFAPPKLLGRIG
ncbi:MAG TPA: phosphohistidine phosphatase SixA [Vicinamibacterales bacterium]|nr:phosphohistidine phosphatase SixA [Vicinamibacterales bacterium]